MCIIYAAAATNNSVLEADNPAALPDGEGAAERLRDFAYWYPAKGCRAGPQTQTLQFQAQRPFEFCHTAGPTEQQ